MFKVKYFSYFENAFISWRLIPCLLPILISFLMTHLLSNYFIIIFI